MKKICCLLAVALFAVLQAPARAGFLTGPGQTTSTGGSALPTFTSPAIENVTKTLNGSGGNFVATVKEEVFVDPNTHGLDFLFQVSTSATSANPIVELDVANYTNYYPVTVDWANNGSAPFNTGTVTTSTADSSPDGSLVEFLFSGTGVGDSQTSKWVFVETLASSVATAPLTLDGSRGTVTDSSDFFGPSGPIVPAPSPAVLACSALPVLALGVWLARRKKPNPSVAA